MQNPEKPITFISCLKCGEALICGAINGLETCWCDALPNIMPLNTEAAGCYCQACLEEMLKEKAPQ